MKPKYAVFRVDYDVMSQGKEDLSDLSLKEFITVVEQFPSGNAFGCTYTSQLNEDLIKRHRRAFPWHHADTKRSYTQEFLRPHGNRGKKEDFAYYNRMMRYFAIDQFALALEKKNAIVSFWDPRRDSKGEHKPCLIALNFIDDGKFLSACAIFRKRDLLRRFIGNCMMLRNWLEDAAKVCGKKPGRIIDFSMEATWRKEDLTKFKNTL